MKKIGILTLALVLALGSLGVGYALWSDLLYIQGTVNTGNVSAEWSLDGYGDDETKDVSYVEAEIIGDTLYVTVHNAYPCIEYWVNFDVTNTGSIPIWICDLYCYNGIDPSWVVITDFTSRQVEPYTSEWGYIYIHLDNTALQNTTYSFQCDLTVIQYNEAPGACPQY